MTMPALLRYSLLALLVCGCAPNLDAQMWDCQLEVQKGNAGKSPEAAVERARDIAACMDRRGYQIDVTKNDCIDGSVDASCYKRK